MRGNSDPSEAVKTPRQSGSLESWPLYRQLAREVAKASREAFFVRASAGAGITASANARLEAISSEATRIATAFEFWEHSDPGPDLRRAAIARLLDMRAEAKDLGADL